MPFDKKGETPQKRLCFFVLIEFKIVMSRIFIEQIERERLVSEIAAAVLQGVQNIIKEKEQSIEDKENWTIEETAKYLKVSKVTIHAYVRQGILKKHKIGSRTLFKKSEVLASVKAQKSIEI